MSLDLLFFSPKELTDQQVRETARAWAESTPHAETAELDDGKIQLWYDNEETFVHFSLSEIDTDLTGFIEEMRPMARDAAPNGYMLSPWQFNMNFFRPSFCAAEAMPHLADFARMMNFLILETHEMEIVPAEPDQLVGYWREANKRAVAVAFFNQDVEGMSVYRTGSSEPDETGTVQLDQANFEQVLTGGQDPAIDLIGIDRVLLETFWQHNLSRLKQQEAIQAFVPKIMLITLGPSAHPATMCTWSRDVWTAFPDTTHVLLNRPESGRLWWKNPAKFSIAETADVLRVLKENGAVDRCEGALWLTGQEASMENGNARLFDLVERSVAHPLEDSQLQLLDGLAGVVDADVLTELSEGIAKH